jgi:transposase InsO family protein
VLDLSSKRVIGWHMDKYLHKELVIEAMRRAISSRTLWIRNKVELIFHSDQGIQYASDEFKSLLKKYNISQSMSRKGDCYDNAVTESFFHTLKTEWVSFKRYLTREEARLSIFHYIELYYNTRRMHSSLGYMSPVDFEKRKIMIQLTVHFSGGRSNVCY